MRNCSDLQKYFSYIKKTKQIAQDNTNQEKTRNQLCYRDIESLLSIPPQLAVEFEKGLRLVIKFQGKLCPHKMDRR